MSGASSVNGDRAESSATLRGAARSRPRPTAGGRSSSRSGRTCPSATSSTAAGTTAPFRLGDDLTIRLPRSRFYAEQVAKEQRWLPLLAPHLPVPIPRPVAQGSPGLGLPARLVRLRLARRGSGDTRADRRPGRLRPRGGGVPGGAAGRATPPTARSPASTTGGGVAPSTTTSTRPGPRWPPWPTRSTCRRRHRAILDAAVASPGRTRRSGSTATSRSATCWCATGGWRR